MKKLLTIILILLGMTGTVYATVLNSNQIASSTPTLGYLPLSYGANTPAIWVATSTLGITQDLTNYVTHLYASSTFPTFTYSSSTFVTFTYGSSTYALSANTPSYTYASSTFASTSYIVGNFPTYTYASSTYVPKSTFQKTIPGQIVTYTIINPGTGFSGGEGPGLVGGGNDSQIIVDTVTGGGGILTSHLGSGGSGYVAGTTYNLTMGGATARVDSVTDFYYNTLFDISALTSDQTYTFPDKTGVFALTSDIPDITNLLSYDYASSTFPSFDYASSTYMQLSSSTAYVPYTGANQTLNLDSQSFTTNGTSTFGGRIFAPTGSASIPSYSFTNFTTSGLYIDNNGNSLGLDFAGNKLLTMNGTMATVTPPLYVSNGATVNGNLSVNSTTTLKSLIVDSGINATTTVTFGAVGRPYCGKYRDSDDAGWTYVTYKSGVQTATTTSCE